MQTQNRRFASYGVLILAGTFLLSGCVATRKWTRTDTDTRISTATKPINDRIGKAEDATKANAERIDAVDKRAQDGIKSVDDKVTVVRTAAANAQTAADAAKTAADTANRGVATNTTNITTVRNGVNSLSDDYTPEGDPAVVTFKLGSATLTADAKTALDAVASKYATASKGYMFELQGFTDSTGSAGLNDTLSQRRGEAVMRYLVSKGVPLYRISIVGLGEANPVADNKTSKGREQNRRVEVRTLKTTNKPLGN